MPSKPSEEITGIPGERLRMLVPSRSQPADPPYLVDLEEHQFNGFCGCRDFETRHAPRIREPGWTPGDATRCHHIRAARNWWLEQQLRQVASIANGGHQ